MKHQIFSRGGRRYLSGLRGLAGLLLGMALPGWPAAAAPLQTIHAPITSLVTNLSPVRPSFRLNRLNLCIGLPLRDRAGLTNLLARLYDPASTNYHHFLSSSEFTERFGPTMQDYETVVNFAQKHGLTVTARHANRMVVGVRGPIGEIERAFHVKLNEYQHPTEKRTFFAPDREPSADLAVPVLAVGGLDNFIIPHPLLKPLAKPQGGAELTGSGPSGTFLGNDFRAAYVPGSPLVGSGQTVGLLEFDSGYYQSDISAYEALAGLPNVPVTAVLLDGYNGAAGGGNDEVSLDIEMAVSMAPGLKGILVYEGSTTDDILNRMATDNLAKQIGASWGYSIDATSEQIFLEFAAQGQSFFNASGDSDAYSGAVMTPADDPNVTVVGGTTLTTTGPGGAWVSETVWNAGNGVGSSGGISTQYPIPAWQQGISMAANQGSTTMRNLPDVAMPADNVYVRFGNGQAGDFGGTSCATPLWAAFTALANQLAQTNGLPVAGFLNPTLYAMGKGSNFFSYPSLFHDITTGNNESPASPARFLAVPGYDLCTGWGTPTGSNLLSAIGLPEPLRISPGGGVILTGPAGGPFNPGTQTYTLTNGANNAINWMLANTSVWFNVSPAAGTLTPGGPGAAVTIRLSPLATNLPPGAYAATFWFTNQTDGFVQARQVAFDVVTPPVIVVQPTNEAVLMGLPASLNVTVGPNALVYYQWQENGTNLADSGRISGSATGTLVITNVLATDVGTYSVTVSNTAGVFTSSNAALTIMHSAPVIVSQPTNTTVLPGAPAVFSVVAAGDTPYHYQWRFNGANLINGAGFSGTTTSTLVVSSVSAINAGVYSVVISNSLGSVTSTGAVLSLISVTAPGFTLSTGWSFAGGTSGEFLFSPLVQGPDHNFYGTTVEGGSYGVGSIFRWSTNGTLATTAYFNGNNGEVIYGGLCLGKDGNFYGTAVFGGTYGDGTIFETTTGGGLSTLTSLNGNNGTEPVAGLTQGADGNFYGTMLEGGPYGYGTIFRVNSSGALTTLVAFNLLDGAFPSGVLAQGADGSFYGTTENGGPNEAGNIFKMTPAGALTSLYTFTDGNDGGSPIAGLVQATDGNFYGVTYEGGAGGYGTVFKMTPAGALTTLYAFTGGNDGGSPWGGLLQAADGNLYGTTSAGGTYGDGTVFQIAPSGALTTVVQFDGYNGALPSAAMIQGSDGNLYGTTEGGGLYGLGALYRISVGGPLAITGQPTDQASYLGGTAIFTVATSGAGPVSYQWQQNGINLVDGGNISGTATATLRITNVTLADLALYSVVASNAFNSVTSEYAALEVIYSAPTITSQPVSQTRVTGATATFAVTASGDQPLSFQWQENGTNLTDGGNVSGSATSTLTLANVTPANSGAYSVIVSNAVFALASHSATLSVVPVTPPFAAQSERHLFAGTGDGAFCFGGLVQGRDGNLYGVAQGGGSQYEGTIFRLTLSGTFSAFYSFNNGTPGAEPMARLAQAPNGYFYGTAATGGSNGDGALFSVSPSFNVSGLYSFMGGADGETPETGLTVGTDGNLYGVSTEGGANLEGAVFKSTPGGSLSPLYEFTGGADGSFPICNLAQGKDGKFYGTTAEGGSDADGTVFSLTTNGVLTTLVSFNAANGAQPAAGVIQGADGNLYGTTAEGGAYGDGTVFSLTTNGVLTTLFSFAGTNGSLPAAELVQGSDGNFYGTCNSGGAGGQGTAFKITTNGTLTTLLYFYGANGASPEAALVQASDGNFYGTTPFGGNGFDPSAGGGNGTLFRLTVPTFLTNTLAGQAVACLPYVASIASSAVAPSGDPLKFAKVSGPAWLAVAANGLLSGTPTNSDIGANSFVVSLTDSNGIVATAALDISVIPDPPAFFLSNPFAEPWANMDENYAASIATNGLAPYLGTGDTLTFAKVSGPAWLNVAPNGDLSGVPDGTDAGTNLFTVSVADLGGGSGTATLAIYVNRPPVFSPGSFAKPAATVGEPYAGTLATNAVDLDLVAGDTLAFYKVTGPAWLNVAPNGALAGTPTSTDVGAGSFMVLVVDSGGLAGVGSMNLNVSVDHAPVFGLTPFTGPPVVAGQQYSATIATNASDADYGDRLTFAKLAGPAWLTVAPGGGLSGMPLSIDAGANSFVVNVRDLAGLSNNATLLVNVTAVPLALTLTRQTGGLALGWSGAVPPYQIQASTNPALSPWQNLGTATSTTNQMVFPANPAMFYRVRGN